MTRQVSKQQTLKTYKENSKIGGKFEVGETAVGCGSQRYQLNSWGECSHEEFKVALRCLE